MEYNNFAKILNEIIFDKSKALLIEKIARSPNRYIGLFRPTKPKAKILQNLLQSHEIRFGDAFEILIEKYLIEFDFSILDKGIMDGEGNRLTVDQCFHDSGKTFFVEQKIRDDHDSSKKRGQINNFEKKLSILSDKYGETNVTGIFYFIDPDLQKNKKYYFAELNKMATDYGVVLHLFYGEELFGFFNKNDAWKEILAYLEQWKNDIPDLPETNFDKEPEKSFDEIKDLSPSIYRNLLNNDDIFNEIVLTIFPEKQTLNLLFEYFESKASEKAIYETLTNLLREKL